MKKKISKNAQQITNNIFLVLKACSGMLRKKICYGYLGRHNTKIINIYLARVYFIKIH